MEKQVKQYCIIYGKSDTDPGPFVLAVTDNQDYINGFREEHYHLCLDGEIVKDDNYDQFADFHIIYEYGHYLTPTMLTGFADYCLDIYNRLTTISDLIERELEYFKFLDYEQDAVDEGFSLLLELMVDSAPVEYTSSIDAIIRSCNILDVASCMDDFLSTYQPDPSPF